MMLEEVENSYSIYATKPMGLSLGCRFRESTSCVLAVVVGDNTAASIGWALVREGRVGGVKVPKGNFGSLVLIGEIGRVPSIVRRRELPGSSSVCS